MQAFQKAIWVDSTVAKDESGHLCGLHESIAHALALNDNQFRFFAQNGLTRDNLEIFDRNIHYHVGTTKTIHSMSKQDLDIFIPFIQNLGNAYSQLVANSLAANKNSENATIQHAGAIHPILNFFYAQKAKLYPNSSNEPTYRNE